MNDHTTLVNFVLERALEAPNATRIKLYRGLAKICGDQKMESNLKTLAGSLESTEKLCREFNFSFIQENKD